MIPLVHRPKLHICAACCTDSQMELIVYLEESLLEVYQNRVVQLVDYGC